jgi:hypothetical protein
MKVIDDIVTGCSNLTCNARAGGEAISFKADDAAETGMLG